MNVHTPEAELVAADLLALTERLRDRAGEDPFGNPVLAVALGISRRMEDGSLGEAGVEALIRVLRDQSFDDRAARIARYVGGVAPGSAETAYTGLARRLVRPDPSDSPVQFAQFREGLERTRFAAVFTAHPTFAVPTEVFRSLAETASGRPSERFATHRPQRPTLEQEFAQAVLAMENGRDAIDGFNAALFRAASAAWPDRWSDLVPRAIVLASWVGYDTDGRVDINWWDTLRLRLRMKRLQLERLRRQVEGISAAAALVERLDRAIVAVTRQIDAAPTSAAPEAVAAFAAALIGGRDEAIVTPAPLLPLFAQAIRDAATLDEKIALGVARAGLVSHGMSLAHTHVRLNAAQVHNAVRLRLGLDDPPADPFRRRVLLSAVNAALESVQPIPIDFGALIGEQASATRLVMTVAQIAKHIDGDSPIRFLIAETESGYTLLSMLWMAKLFGIEKNIEISPLFETADALEHGARAVEEALRSPHYRAYLKSTGRLAIEFGYSDSGRYVGPLAATFLIERLRMKLAEMQVRFGLADVELILFDTHGESIGRGAHPGSLTDRLKYLSPSTSRAAFAAQKIRWRDESSFQGGDGYLLFGTPELAAASIARIAEQAFDPPPTTMDPIYGEADFTADFFASIGAQMRELVEDPGYASLLGAFGPALLDSTGSRPTARQSDGMGGPAVIRHPRELRAIPNNAILQQLGWCANTLQGLGAAAARQPEPFAEFQQRSPRFRRAIELAAHGLRHSDLEVLRANVALLDPGSWLDRAAHSPGPGEAQKLVAVARALGRLALWAPIQAMFRRIQTDNVLLHAAWPDAPHMSNREVVLHALRIALIQRIWMIATEIPDFSPRHGVTRQALELRILQLDIPAALKLLGEVFPDAPDPSADRDYGEPHGPRAAISYARLHATIFEPMGRLFGLVREIGTAVTHEVGAFG